MKQIKKQEMLHTGRLKWNKTTNRIKKMDRKKLIPNIWDFTRSKMPRKLSEFISYKK